MSRHALDGGQRHTSPAEMPQLEPIAESVADLLSQRLRLVSSPLRIRLVDYLSMHGATSVQVLADEIGVTQQSASKALQGLHRSGIVERRREGRRVWYQLIDATLVGLYEQTALGVTEVASIAQPDTASPAGHHTR